MPEPLAFLGIGISNGLIILLGGEHKGDDSHSVFSWDTYGEFNKLKDLPEDQTCDSSSLIIKSENNLLILGAGEEVPNIFRYKL